MVGSVRTLEFKKVKFEGSLEVSNVKFCLKCYIFKTRDSLKKLCILNVTYEVFSKNH